MTTSMLKEAKAKALEAVGGIDGWLTRNEAETLFDLAANATGPIVEIGSWQGRSTAALALGSMAGNKQPVYAIDSFKGVPPLDRHTEHGANPGWNSSTPELLRANLDRVGVNGLIHIIAKGSQEALDEAPAECDALFIDGDHSYKAVMDDFSAYLPRLRRGGRVLIHDCWEADPDVVKAVDDFLMTRQNEWRPLRRIDSAMLFERQSVPRYKVMVGAPGSLLKPCAVNGIAQASLGAHDAYLQTMGTGFDDMAILWVAGLNAAKAGNCTHFAMLHSDVQPCSGWLDILIGELEALNADLVSTVMPIKCDTGVTSVGIGDKDDHWHAYRRFTMREIMEMPETFSVKDTPHPDRYLLHNTGCWVADLRKSVWWKADEQGYLPTFSFPIAARIKEDGTAEHLRESEDWYFSRKMHELGAKAFITRKVRALHVGDFPYSNTWGWGTFENGDEDTAVKWRKN